MPEDAVTGSSNGSLAGYLARHRVLGASGVEVSAGQSYEIGRPATLALRTRETQGAVAVFVGGSVVDVAEGVWG